MNPRYLIVIGAAAVTAFIVGGSVFATHQPRSATTTTSSMPSYCAPNTPQNEIATCESENAQLNQQAALTWPASGSPITESQAIQDAQLPNQANSTSYAFETTYGEAGTYMEATNPRVSPTTPVWIVTIHLSTPISLNMSPSDTTPNQIYSEVTVIEDGINGTPINSCDGCDVVQPDGTVRSVKA